MKKIILVIFLILINIFFLFSDEVLLTNGDIIKGEIITMDDDFLILKTSYGEVKIQKDNIDSIKNIQNNIHTKRENSTSLSLPDEQTTARDLYLEQLQKDYKSFVNAGSGFLVPGMILTFTPLIFATPPVVMGMASGMITFPPFAIGFAMYTSSIACGLIFDIISIICFANARDILDKWENEIKVLPYIGMNDTDAIMGIAFKY